MKPILKAIAVAALGTVLAAGPVLAGKVPSFTPTPNSTPVKAVVLETYPVFGPKRTRVRKVCEDVEVPVYGGPSPSDQLGNTVAGAIIGGVIGQAVTGNKQGATAGAIVGGVAGATAGQRVVGYRTERRCRDEVVERKGKRKYWESRVRIRNKVYLVRTQNRLRPGTTFTMYMPN